MPLDNRNRKPTQNNPDIKELIESDEPIKVTENQQDLIDDAIADPKNQIEEDKETKDKVEPVKPEEEDKEDKETEDYKEKFKESSKESLNNYFKYKKLTETITEVSNMPDPTDEQLRAYAKDNGAEYDELDSFSQNILKKTWKNEVAMGSVTQVVQEANQIDKWVMSVDDYISSSEVENKYPTLADNAEAFRSYCLKASRRGMDLADLSASFLFNLDKPGSKKQGKSLFNAQGNGRSVTDTKPKEGITADDLAVLRVNNPREYKRLIQQGKAKISL